MHSSQGQYQNTVEKKYLELCAQGWQGKDEEWDYQLSAANIEGELPKDLSGTLFRNGPGNHQIYRRTLKHPLDGDGYIVKLTFQEQQVHLQSRFVATRTRKEELKQKKMLYWGPMGSTPWNKAETIVKNAHFSLMKSGYKPTFRNPSNTNCFEWGGRLISCYESQLPCTLDPWTLKTIKEDNFSGLLELANLGSHFKIDPREKNIILFSRKKQRDGSGRAIFYAINDQWQLVDKINVQDRHLNYFHDFALTKNYIVLHISPFQSWNKLKTFKFKWGMLDPSGLMNFDPCKRSEFLVISRKSGEIIKRFPVAPFHIFHFANSYEENSKIYFSAVTLGTDFNMGFDSGVWLANGSKTPGKLTEFSLDLEAEVWDNRIASIQSVAFPRIHPFRAAAPSRYCYVMASTYGKPYLPFTSLVKYDRWTNQKEEWDSGLCLGEPIFVPKEASLEEPMKGKEDSGYIITQAYDPLTRKSLFLIFNAKKIYNGPICKLHLDHLVPFGLHGNFTESLFL